MKKKSRKWKKKSCNWKINIAQMKCRFAQMQYAAISTNGVSSNPAQTRWTQYNIKW